MNISLLCPAKCGAVLTVRCGEFEQSVACSRCNERFLFLNEGTITCDGCSQEVTYRLKSDVDSAFAFCERCRTDLSRKLTRPAMPYRFKHEAEFQYCGLDHISGYEQQVVNAQRAFRVIDSIQGVGERRYAFVEVVVRTDTGFAAPKIRFAHITCNFSFSPSHNKAKMMSFLFDTAVEAMLSELVKRGVAAIWFATKDAQARFEQMPSLSSFKTRFKTLPDTF